MGMITMRCQWNRPWRHSSSSQCTGFGWGLGRLLLSTGLFTRFIGVGASLFGRSIAKYCRMEVRAWLGAGWWALILPGGGVGEVQPAGAVQGFFRGAGVQAGWQDGVLVAVAAGQVDGKAPPAGRPAIAEPAQRESLLVGELAVDIGELTAEA